MRRDITVRPEELRTVKSAAAASDRSLDFRQNAIIQAATLAQSIEGGTIYVTHQPCVICAKMIINAGISRIVVKEGYPDELAVEMLEEAGLRIIMLGE